MLHLSDFEVHVVVHPLWVYNVKYLHSTEHYFTLLYIANTLSTIICYLMQTS